MEYGARQWRIAGVVRTTVKNGSTLWQAAFLHGCGKQLDLWKTAAENPYPIGFKNSTPTKWTSPACWCLFTLAWMGAIPAGTKAEDVIEGAGIVRVTISFTASGRGHVMNAPNPLISSVLASSRNCSPCASLPRTNIGICKCIRWNRLRSSSRGDMLTLWWRTFSLTPISTPVLVLTLVRNFSASLRG
jgi:hypothetical protein